jgi:hypothetical protein
MPFAPFNNDRPDSHSTTRSTPLMRCGSRPKSNCGAWLPAFAPVDCRAMVVTPHCCNQSASRWGSAVKQSTAARDRGRDLVERPTMFLCPATAPRPGSQEIVFAHDPGDALVIDQHASPAQLRGDPSIDLSATIAHSGDDMPRRRQGAHLFELAKRGAEVRLRELVREGKYLIELFPDLRDSFDTDELPVSFILARGARRARKQLARQRRRQRMSTVARKALSQRMKRYWTTKRKAAAKA